MKFLSEVGGGEGGLSWLGSLKRVGAGWLGDLLRSHSKRASRWRIKAASESYEEGNIRWRRFVVGEPTARVNNEGAHDRDRELRVKSWARGGRRIFGRNLITQNAIWGDAV